MTFQSNVLKTFDKIVRILQPNKHHEIRNLIEIRDFFGQNSIFYILNFKIRFSNRIQDYFEILLYVSTKILFWKILIERFWWKFVFFGHKFQNFVPKIRFSTKILYCFSVVPYISIKVQDNFDRNLGFSGLNSIFFAKIRFFGYFFGVRLYVWTKILDQFWSKDNFVLDLRVYIRE